MTKFGKINGNMSTYGSSFQYSVLPNGKRFRRDSQPIECLQVMETTVNDVIPEDSCNGTTYRQSPSMLKYLLTCTPDEELPTTSMECSAGNIRMEENANSPEMFVCETKRKRSPFRDPENILLELDDAVEDKLKILIAKSHDSSKTDKSGFPSDGSSSGYITADSTSSNEQTTNTKKMEELQRTQNFMTEQNKVMRNYRHWGST
ncbi:uncharacterized protein LOC127735141 [Mytilus californianus]|uniref:uncharacterized protein LOC127735141 n=1 Tax=Mytilus californianus TaxID=6549 RepID=UPI0022475221|nr:uncharacterized protein LOC127735141 [Mytilus californianus]